MEGRYSCTGTCFDIGVTTREALLRFGRTGDPDAGATAPDTAGNGSLMRLAPAAILHAGDDEAADRLARAQSRTTHGAPQAVEACAFAARVLAALIRGGGDALRPRAWDGDPAIREIAAGAWRGRPRDAIRSSGYVIHTLEAALWAVDRTHTFRDALVLAVNLGEDADTVGAVAGQLAGARYGASAIPPDWLARLAWRAEIEAAADRLLAPGRAG